MEFKADNFYDKDTEILVIFIVLKFLHTEKGFRVHLN